MTDPEPKPLEPSAPPDTPSEIPFGEQPVTTVETLPPPEYYSPRPFPPWSIWDVMAVLGFTVVAILGFSAIALAIAHATAGGHHLPLDELATNPLVVIGAQFAAYPLVIVFMIALVRIKSGERFWRVIRWNWPGAAALAYFLGGIFFAFLVELASRWLPIPKSLPVDKFFSDATGAYLMAAFGITLAPLLEELFFRGMLYPLLRRAWGVALGVEVTAVAFAAIHGAQLGYAWGPLLSILVVGVVFTLARERANSVAASFLMHCGYNTALFALLWLGSDHFQHLEKVTN
jgi:membrane protease YdiL (CAAX protease family)